MPKKKTISINNLPQNFQISQHLDTAESQASGIQFLCKLLGERDDKVFCEANDGIYVFEKKDVIDIDNIHARLDLVVVDINSRVSISTTMARLLRTSRSLGFSSDSRGAESKTSDVTRDVIDALAYPGHHEWRGLAAHDDE